MTLFKQMAIGLSLLITIILGSVMALNYEIAKQDTLESLYQTTVNNISSLTHKLAQTGGDPAVITSVIDSEFDSGYYKSISFQSNTNNFHYKQEQQEESSKIPLWFIHLTNIKIKPINSDVTSDWNLLGVVTVTADPTIVYKTLYQTFTNLLGLFVVFVTLALLLLYLFLHMVLRPLKRVQHQAEAILNNEFVIEKKIPYTTEFKEVSFAMNAMVKKVEEIFNKANEAAKRNHKLLYQEPVTKLFNRRYLMLKLPELLTLETKHEGGSIILIALSGAEKLNRLLGRQEADNFFSKFAAILTQSAESIEEKIVSRANGTEFILMLPDCESYLSEDISRHIFESFLELLESYELDVKEVYINLGIYRYRPNVTVAQLLTRVDDALTKAKADERQNIYIYEEKNAKEALPKEEWRAIFDNAIKKNAFNLKFYGVVDTKTKKIVHNVMTFTMYDDQKKLYQFGDFIAPAISLGVVGKIYLVILKNLLKNKDKNLSGTICSIRLSNEFLRDKKAFEELSKLFASYAKKLTFTLDFEVAETFAVQNSATLKGYVALFNKYGFGFGLNAFMGETHDFTYLKELNPAFIKSDISFLLDQTQESMDAFDVITKSLGIEIIATFVQSQEEIRKVQKLQIYKIQGPITDSF